MNKSDFQICYDTLDAISERTSEQEKTYKKLDLILQQIAIQEKAQEDLTKIRESLQELDK